MAFRFTEILDSLSISFLRPPVGTQVATWRLLVSTILVAACLAGLVEEAPVAGPPDSVHGEQLYLEFCSACHHELSKVGPPMIDSTSYFINSGVPAEAMGMLLQHPVRQRPDGSIMPTFTPAELSDADLNDIGYFLGVQTPVPESPPELGSAERGEGLYMDNCAICHGTVTDFEGKVLPLAFFVDELRNGGAPPCVIIAFVNLSSRSGYVKNMPTYGEDELSDTDLLDIAAFIWGMPAPHLEP